MSFSVTLTPKEKSQPSKSQSVTTGSRPRLAWDVVAGGGVKDTLSEALIRSLPKRWSSCEVSLSSEKGWRKRAYYSECVAKD